MSIKGLNPNLLEILSRELSPILEEHGQVLKITPNPGLSEDQKRILHASQDELDELYPDIISMARDNFNHPEAANRLISILDDTGNLDKFLKISNQVEEINLHHADDLINEIVSNSPYAREFLEDTLSKLITIEFNNKDFNTAYAILDICNEFGLKKPTCASQLDEAIEKQIAA